MLLFFADDFSYYWFHRISHESRFFWASHVVHHSSTHYNLSTALRQTWVPMTYFPFWLWMPAVGFEPWMVLLAQSWSLIYQFWIHTERVRKLPRFLEGFLNTPSHHRVHHGSNQVYLDRNYGGILIIWDRLFGTWEPEGERVRYGLTKNINTFNPVRAAFHEYIAMWHDIRRARRLRDRLGVLYHGPGWAPPGIESEGSRRLARRWCSRWPGRPRRPPAPRATWTAQRTGPAMEASSAPSTRSRGRARRRFARASGCCFDAAPPAPARSPRVDRARARRPS